MFRVLRAFLIFWARFGDTCVAMNLRRGIVRFLFANLLWLVIKPCIILFGWYIIAYATVHNPLILASLKGCVTVSLILIDLGNSILNSGLWPISPTYSIFFWGISLFYGILKSQRFRNSILQINNRRHKS